MEKNQDITVLNFIAQCNEFVDGKYLFANTKLESLYKSLLESPAIIELFLQCSEDFKYSLEKTKAFIKLPTKVGTFTPPQDLDKFLALSFGILKEIDEKIIDFNTFVPKYFSDDAKTPPTQRFANEIIKPLKNTVAKYFELDASNKTHFKPEDVEVVQSAEEETEVEQSVSNQASELSKQETQNSNNDLEDIFIRPKQMKMDEFENGTELIDENELNSQSREITIKNLLAIAEESLKNMLEIVKTTNKLNPQVKMDAVFVLLRAIHALEKNEMENFYSEIISLKYMQRTLRVLRREIKSLLEIIEAFEVV